MDTDMLLSPMMEFLNGSSPSTSNDSIVFPTITHSPSTNETCPVCGDVAWTKHFGIVCCNACAAFFRRSVSLRKIYTCVRGKNCEVTHETSRHLCKYCRFFQSVRVGMNISAVFTRPTQTDFDPFNESALLQKLLQSRNSTFVSRFNAAIKINNGRQDLIELGKYNPHALDTSKATRAEFLVMMSYLAQCGIRQCIDELQLTKLGACLFYQWLSFNSITATLRNGGHNINQAFFVDESHLVLKEEQIFRYVETFKEIVDPNFVISTPKLWNDAKTHTFNFCNSVVNTAIKLHKTRLDETEYAVINQIMCLKMASRIFPENQNLKRYMDVIFLNLRKYYETNFDCVATKLGNLILLTNEIETVTSALEESIISLSRIGYQPVLTQIMRTQLFSNLFNFNGVQSKSDQAELLNNIF